VNCAPLSLAAEVFFLVADFFFLAIARSFHKTARCKVLLP
jgi:hypothetical protein